MNISKMNTANITSFSGRKKPEVSSQENKGNQSSAQVKSIAVLSAIAAAATIAAMQASIAMTSAKPAQACQNYNEAIELLTAKNNGPIRTDFSACEGEDNQEVTCDDGTTVCVMKGGDKTNACTK